MYPHGSVDKLPYVTMGSGSLAAMGVFEDGFRPDMSLEEGCKLVRDAIAAGIFNDLGSGSNVDLCIITADGVDYKRPYVISIPPRGLAVCVRVVLRACCACVRAPACCRLLTVLWARYELANEKGERSNVYSYKPGTTAVTHTEVEVISETVEPVVGGAAAAAPMDE